MILMMMIMKCKIWLPKWCFLKFKTSRVFLCGGFYEGERDSCQFGDIFGDLRHKNLQFFGHQFIGKK
ncbi:hypothetical protein BpHYR1_025481 [Brachionus plicatilis]|uniref:Uncharacterized protein n=1 Tax=Brachionus plicatilis TaxID=10195 RepID=A0A3M7PB14_BRAPC|nr:hypothetical protein BpHYR1_025481 [Brachionus plicatilis]